MKTFLRLFSKHKNIDSKLLNLLGFQIIRYLIARALYVLRPFPVDKTLKQHVKDLRRDGMLAIPDFMPEKAFQELKKEYHQLIETGTPNPHHHGDTVVNHFDCSKLSREQAPHLHAFFYGKVNTLIQAAEKRKVLPEEGAMLAEHVTVGKGEDMDTQSDPHTDIFFHTHKAWLFLEDVDTETGPLAYFPTSQNLRLKRMRYMYRESIGLNRASRRVTWEEVEDTGLKEKAFTCKANTLVMADVHGFHRRIHGVPGRQRYAVLVSFRFNPFVPQFALKAARGMSFFPKLSGAGDI